MPGGSRNKNRRDRTRSGVNSVRAVLDRCCCRTALIQALCDMRPDEFGGLVTSIFQRGVEFGWESHQTEMLMVAFQRIRNCLRAREHLQAAMIAEGTGDKELVERVVLEGLRAHLRRDKVHLELVGIALRFDVRLPDWVL